MTVDISDFKGKTIESVLGGVGDEEVVFNMTDGTRYTMMHIQDCCEQVLLNDVDGELEDLIGSPILLAECVNSDGWPAPEHHDESYTWTFYKLSTIKSSATLRWLGESNWYYSEEVQIVKDPA